MTTKDKYRAMVERVMYGGHSAVAQVEQILDIIEHVVRTNETNRRAFPPPPNTLRWLRQFEGDGSTEVDRLIEAVELGMNQQQTITHLDERPHT